MASNRKRKTERCVTSPDVMKSAVSAVINQKRSAKAVASEFGIKLTTRRRYVKKYLDSESKEQVGYFPKYNARQVFSAEMETQYFLVAAKHNYGHSPAMARKLAYEYALQNKITMPYSWFRDCSAGEEWLGAFLKRHKNLSIRTPEATSLARLTAFNQHNVKQFFTNLDLVYTRNNYGPQSIYNCDETGLTTVQRPSKVIAGKGLKKVASATSQERGQLVTACCTINAIGNSIPPFMVFPRVHFKQHMLFGAPTGVDGTAHPSGWMTAECFMSYTKHFICHARCSKESPVLLLWIIMRAT